MVTIVDPHIKRDPNYKVFKTAEDKGYYVKTKEGKDYDGWARRMTCTTVFLRDSRRTRQ